MTTKDQAIAPTKELLALGAFLGAMYDNKLDGAEMRAAMLQTLSIEAQPPAPDCRTCEYMWIDVDLEKATSKESCARPGGAVCINGSLHKPAPKVVLWRTE